MESTKAQCLQGNHLGGFTLLHSVSQYFNMFQCLPRKSKMVPYIPKSHNVVSSTLWQDTVLNNWESERCDLPKQMSPVSPAIHVSLCSHSRSHKFRLRGPNKWQNIRLCYVQNAWVLYMFERLKATKLMMALAKYPNEVFIRQKSQKSECKSVGVCWNIFDSFLQSGIPRHN